MGALTALVGARTSCGSWARQSTPQGARSCGIVRQPKDVGLSVFGRRRRVPGLRREELAQLAGVSVAYHTRLEQGNGRNVSAEVLDAIARALRLTDAEHAHLSISRSRSRWPKAIGRPCRVHTRCRRRPQKKRLDWRSTRTRPIRPGRSV